MILRAYQVQALRACREQYRAGHRRVLLQLSTGGGKTACASVVCRNATSTGQRVMYVVHRDAILRQTARVLDDVGVTVTTLTAGGHCDAIVPGTVLLASAQTLARRPVPEFDFGIWDESHTFYKLQQRCQGPARWLLLTATPALTSGEPLSAIADAIVTGPSDDTLTDAGYLVPIEVYGAETPDLHGVPRVRGDFHAGKLQQVHMKLVGTAAESMRQHAKDGDRWLRTVVYCAGVAHSQQVCAELCAVGCRAVHIDGTTPVDVRVRLYADLAAQRIDALVNYGVAIEGLDIPEIECIAAFRAMGSLPDFLQSLGRGRRPSVGKARCVYLDGGGNCYRHGWPTVPRQWTLDGKVRLVKTAGLMMCKQCLALYPPAPVCPRCGAESLPVPRRGPRTVAGQLVALTPAMVARQSAAERGVARRAIAAERAAIEAAAVALSRGTPLRPAPDWIANVGLWDTLERRRQRDGYALGYTAATYRALHG